MSGNEYDYDEYEDDLDGSSVLKQLRKENRSKEKQIKELQEQLKAVTVQARERSVKDVLSAQGLNPKIARFIPEDATSEDDILAWIEDNAEIFGGAKVDDQAKAPESNDEAPSPDLSEFSRNGQVQSTGSAYSGDPDQLAALISSARTPAELNKVLFGTESGPGAF